MSTTADAMATGRDAHLDTARGRWITNWNPEDNAQWDGSASG
ncbi:MAG: hypothetical protein WBG92_04835 [Thiohalocapsa sp.]